MTTDDQVLVENPEPLSEEFLPDRFPGRDHHHTHIKDELSILNRGRKPQGLWIHGPAGTGKSSAVGSILGTLEAHRIRTAYVRCWKSQYLHSILEAVFSDLKELTPAMKDTSFKLERLYRFARKHPLVIVLDEIEQLFPTERNAAIYNFSELPNTGLLCVGLSRAPYVSLDPRILSRYRPQFLEFRKYSSPELAAILQDRAHRSLSPSSWCKADLERIASHSQGDARVAIQSLATAAYLGEKRGAPRIRVADIEQGLKESMELRKRYVLAGLSEHHRLLHRIVQEAREIDTREAWRRYVSLASENHLDPMKRRTFNHYKQFLVRNHLLEERQSKGRKNARILKVVT